MLKRDAKKNAMENAKKSEQSSCEMENAALRFTDMRSNAGQLSFLNPEDNKPVYRQSSTSSDDAEKPESWQQLAKRRKMERQEEASYMEYHFIKQNLKCSVVEG